MLNGLEPHLKIEPRSSTLVSQGLELEWDMGKKALVWLLQETMAYQGQLLENSWEVATTNKMTQQLSFLKHGWKFSRPTSQLGSDSFHKGTTRAYV